MDTLKKLWKWLWSLGKNFVTNLLAEMREKYNNITKMTRKDVGSILKRDASHFFLGGAVRQAKKFLVGVPFIDAVTVRYEDSFTESGLQPLTIMRNCLSSCWTRAWCGVNPTSSPIAVSIL